MDEYLYLFSNCIASLFLLLIVLSFPDNRCVAFMRHKIVVIIVLNGNLHANFLNKCMKLVSDVSAIEHLSKSFYGQLANAVFWHVGGICHLWR